MISKLIQFSLILILLSSTGNSQSKQDFSYKNASYQKSYVASIQQYYGEKTMSKQDWKTLDSLSSLVHFPYLRYEINVVYFSIYDKTGPIEKGAEYYKKVVLQGCLFDGIANNKYAQFYEYDSLIEVKNSQIDTNLLNFFNRLDRRVIVFDSTGRIINNKASDSIFMNELDSLVKQYGKWPGIKERGSIHKYKGKTFYPTVLTNLLNEKQAYYYYHLIAKECEQGNERWSITQRIAMQLVSTSQYNDRFFKIRDVAFETYNPISENHFALHYKMGLRFQIRRNTWADRKVTIYPTELWGGSDYNQKLTQLIDLLVDGGIPYESISVKEEVIPLDENEKIANDYYFVFEIEK